VIDTREKILRAGVLLFSKYGYGGTTTQAIAKRARVAETSIYRHFRGKDELFVEVVRVAVNDIGRNFQPAPAGTLEEVIEHAIRCGFDLYTSRRHVLRISYFAVLEGNAAAVALIQGEMAAYFQNFVAAGPRLALDGARLAYLVGAFFRYEHFLRDIFHEDLHSRTGLSLDLNDRIVWLSHVLAAGLRAAASGHEDQAVGSSASSTSIETGIARPGVAP
jgi:AcrR family transcriptional regulator